MSETYQYFKFSECCDLIHGFQFREEHFSEKGYPVVKIGNMKDSGGVNLTKASFVPLDALKKFGKYQLFEGDILMALTGGTLGKVSRVQPNIGVAFQNYRVGKFVAKQNMTDNYIYFLLQSHVVQNRVKLLVNEAAQPNFGKQDFDKIKVAVPPLPEQRKIAEILSTWDEAIRKTEELIELKEKLKKGLMQQLLTGKKRLPGFEGEWNTVKLGDVTSRITRKNDELNDNVVTISAKDGFVLQEQYFNKRVASNNLTNYQLLQKGEFAYNKSYSKGYPMGVFKRLKQLDHAVVTTLYICFRSNGKMDDDFLEYYFESGQLNRGLTKIAQEGARAHGLLNIGTKDFFNLELRIPGQKEQAAIADLVSIVNDELGLSKQKLHLLLDQKKGLMQQLLTGKTRVKVDQE